MTHRPFGRIFVARITPTKVQVDGPDHVFGAHGARMSERELTYLSIY
jgi:hypothetical protein